MAYVDLCIENLLVGAKVVAVASPERLQLGQRAVREAGVGADPGFAR
jgi:hypothetical protein